MQRNRLEIKSAVKVDRGDNVSSRRRHINLLKPERGNRSVYSLQRWNNPTSRMTSARGGSRSGGRHPVACRGCHGITSLLLGIQSAICARATGEVLSVFFRGWRGQVSGSTGE